MLRGIRATNLVFCDRISRGCDLGCLSAKRRRPAKDRRNFSKQNASPFNKPIKNPEKSIKTLFSGRHSFIVVPPKFVRISAPRYSARQKISVSPITETDRCLLGTLKGGIVHTRKLHSFQPAAALSENFHSCMKESLSQLFTYNFTNTSLSHSENVVKCICKNFFLFCIYV